MIEETAIRLKVEDLKVHIFTRRGVGKAVDGVSFELRKGETLGVVGESGSGKSMSALALMGLHPRPAARIVDGRAELMGKDLLGLDERAMQGIRGRHLSIIFQDSMTALNPVMTIREQMYETLRAHLGLRGRDLEARSIELLTRLRVPSPAQRLADYPHQLSGGMRQRVVGAIALSCEPEVLIADEPTTSLDVTVQAAYLQLLREIQDASGLSILFITHDFGVVERICDRVAVMYAGRIVETGVTQEVLNHPQHPYTRALLESVPDLRQPSRRLDAIEGTPPSIFQIPEGCPFEPRCPIAIERCKTEYPPTVVTPQGYAVCWRVPQ